MIIKLWLLTVIQILNYIPLGSELELDTEICLNVRRSGCLLVLASVIIIISFKLCQNWSNSTIALTDSYLLNLITLQLGTLKGGLKTVWNTLIAKMQLEQL